MLRGSWEPGRDAGDWTWGPVAAGPRPSRGCGHCLTGTASWRLKGLALWRTGLEQGLRAGERAYRGPGGRAGRWPHCWACGAGWEGVRLWVCRRAAEDTHCF